MEVKINEQRSRKHEKRKDTCMGGFTEEKGKGEICLYYNFKK